MRPTDFEQANATYVSTDEFTKEQVADIRTFVGVAQGGSCDGVQISVVAWQPDASDIEAFKAGGPIFLTFAGAAPIHMVSAAFHIAIAPA